MIIYSKNNCPKCQMTKQVMTQKGIKYKEINIENDLDEKQREEKIEFFKDNGMMMMPIVEFKNKVGEIDFFSGFRPDIISSMSQGA